MTRNLTLSWQIAGMHCSSCSILIDEAVEDLDGVISSSTSTRRALATVMFDTTRCDADRIAATIRAAGYQASLSTDEASSPARSWFRRRSL